VLGGELQRQKALLAATDAIAVAGAGALSQVLRSGDLYPLEPGNWGEAVAGLVMLVAIWIVFARAVGLYRNGRRHELKSIVKASCAAWLAMVAISFFVHLTPSRLVVGIGLTLTIGSVIAMRTLVRRCIKFFYSRPEFAVPLVIVGANSFGVYLRDRIKEELTQYEFLGFVDENPPAVNGSNGHAATNGNAGTNGHANFNGHAGLNGNGRSHQHAAAPAPVPVLGQLERIASLSFEHPNLEAVIVLPERDHEQIERIIKLCERYRVRWRVMPRVAESMALTVEMVGAIPLIGPPGSNIEGLNCLIKRGFDVVVATLMLLVASPIMLLAALAIWLTDGSPLLFRQTRVGIHGKPFELLKFRTMRSQAPDTVHREYVKEWIQRNAAERTEADGAKIYKIGLDPRVTPVGKWLRRFSLDELPQLLNVMYGDMSLIGPRPAMPYELELYQEWHRHRLDAPPGITGLWQVSGRNRLSFEEMVQLDIEYIEEWSLVGDVGILLRTLPAMLQGSGM
jgi:exopolysaccharide biosynthesis polyprenyl glycosylphosphotransferase